MGEPDLGSNRTFADAVQEKYGDPLSGAMEALVVGAPGCDRAVDVMLTSKKEIEQLTRRITLTHMRIDSVGQLTDEMSHRLCQVKELDISFNEIPNWPVLTEIIAKLPACQELVVSGNSQIAYACDFPYDEVITFKTRMKNVTTIIMASCEYEWPMVMCTALEVWPQSLKSLSLHGNVIRELSVPPATCFKELQSLDLSGNPITDWDQVCKLGSSLPVLRDLSVSDCKIEIISFDGKDAGNLFPSLKKLNISNNKLTCWIDVSELRFLTQLTDLNLKGNPVIAGGDYAACFNQVLGRLSGLTKLNGEQVTEAMYLEAEKYYVKIAFKESVRKGPGKEFDSSHPRFNELLQKYGAPEEAPVKAKSVCVSLLAEDGNEITKKLPYSTTISSLKVLMKRTFGLDPTSEIDLILKTRKEDEYEYVLNEEDNPLSYYDVGNDDVILIKTK